MEKSNFVDKIRIFARSGHGGAGSKHFLRNKLTAKGGPDGGDGGRGGNIVLKGNAQLWTLLHLRYYKNILAKNGDNGGANRRTGKNGDDIIIEVPLGTLAIDEETGKKEIEILHNDEEVVWMPGGKGGLGNSHFKSATNQTPQYAQAGLPGEEGYKILELKMLANVGLVGFPNAGKSTLLSVISAAKPVIADYPFTTIQPQLGVVPYRQNKSFVVADIPGIIEGASEGKGLGHRFLRHIERNAALVFLIPADAQNPKETYKILLNELKKYNPELLQKNKIIAVSKIDMVGDDELKQIIKQLPKKELIIPFSAQTGKNLDELKDAMWQAVHQ